MQCGRADGVQLPDAKAPASHVHVVRLRSLPCFGDISDGRTRMYCGMISSRPCADILCLLADTQEVSIRKIAIYSESVP